MWIQVNYMKTTDQVGHELLLCFLTTMRKYATGSSLQIYVRSVPNSGRARLIGDLGSLFFARYHQIILVMSCVLAELQLDRFDHNLNTDPSEIKHRSIGFSPKTNSPQTNLECWGNR